VEMLCGRRKSKKTYEYEVKWVGRRENKNSWITREKYAAFRFALSFGVGSGQPIFGSCQAAWYRRVPCIR